MGRGVFFVALVALCTLAPAGGGAQESTFVEMKVTRVVLDPSAKTPTAVVILENAREKKLIPIWIGSEEATSIALELENVAIPRPNTHDLIRNILQRIGATLQRITITDRGRPVALLTPVDEGKEEAALWAMVREGLARWGGGKPDLPKRRVRIRGGPISDTVIEGRR